MAPTRVAIIGLSANGCWAATAHLPYLQKSSKYAIVGVCNSSIQAGEAAVKAYELPSTTKVYKSTAEVASDPDVDLVVCSVSASKHYETVHAAVESGKPCYVEWPLEADHEKAKALAALAHKGGQRTLVGLQSRASPAVNAIKTLVDSGTIGKVLNVTAYLAAVQGGPSVAAGYKVLLNRQGGTNVVSVHFSHFFDSLRYILGDLATFTSVLSIGRPEVKVLDNDGNVVENAKTDVPDQIMLQGRLQSGAVISAVLRGGTSFKGKPAVEWKIYGEKGEITLTASNAYINVGSPDTEIKLHNHETDEVETIDWSKDAQFMDLPLAAQNVAELYEAFADGNTAKYADWDEAMKLQDIVKTLWQNFDAEKQ